MLLAALGGGAVVYHQQERSRQASNVGTLGKTLLTDLKAAQIAAIRIAEPKATLTLEQKDGRWTIAERAGFPADYGKVREFVLKAIELKVGQSEPVGEQDRARLNLDESATRLEFLGADGKVIATLLAGKKHFRQEPENPGKAPGDGRFVMRPGEAQVVYIVSDPLAQATARSAEWIDRTAFAAEKVKTLEVRFPDGENWRIERQADNADWKLSPLKTGEKLDFTKANAASYSLSLLELADVAPKDAKPDATGLDKPVLLNATTLDGLSYAIRIGKREADNYYVTFSSGGALVREGKDKDHAERIKKVEERLPREKQLSEYVLLIPKSRLEDTLKKRADLLEKKEARK